MFATEKLRSRNSRSGMSGAACASTTETREAQCLTPDKAGQHLRAVPARVVATDDAEYDSENAEADEDHAENIARTLSTKAVRQREEHEWHGDQRDRHVDPEDRLPVLALNDSAADERAERDPESADTTPDADGERPQAAGRIRQAG